MHSRGSCSMTVFQFGLICTDRGSLMRLGTDFVMGATPTSFVSRRNSLDENGNKMLNEYIREHKIGSSSYGKVALYKSSVDGKHYEIKSFHKSHLWKLRVAPFETAMTDVLR